MEDYTQLILRKKWQKSLDSLSLMLKQAIRRLNRSNCWRCGRTDPVVNEPEKVPCSVHLTFCPASGGVDTAPHSTF